MPDTKVAFLGYRKKWEIAYLKERVCDHVEIVPVPPDASDETAASVCREANVIIPWLIALTPAHLRHAEKLQLVQTLSSGVDNLPLQELAERKITVANNRGANSIAVAEVTIFLIVAVNRQLQVQMNQLIEGTYHGDFFDRWEDFHELSGMRIGIVGLGWVGSAVSRRLDGWGCERVFYDPAEIDREVERSSGARRVEFDELLRSADIVTLHLPLLASTRAMISDREFSLMKPSAVLINTTRGPVVDEAALIRALDDKQIAGAGLDVTETEPIEPDNPLVNRSNVVLTPHLAGVSIEARHRALDIAAENINRVAASNEPISSSVFGKK